MTTKRTRFEKSLDVLLACAIGGAGAYSLYYFLTCAHC